MNRVKEVMIHDKNRCFIYAYISLFLPIGSDMMPNTSDWLAFLAAPAKMNINIEKNDEGSV